MGHRRIRSRASALFTSGWAAFLLSGCFGGGIQSTIDPKSDATRIIQSLYGLVTWIDIGIFVVVFGFLIITILRFREKPGQGIPKQVRGHLGLEIIWTIIPALLLVFIAIPTWSGIFRAYSPPSGNSLKVEAIGHQWWWEFNYPELGVVTANEMHIPVGRPIVIDTFSKDVVHSFWVPKLAAKIDSLPGHVNTVWFEAEEIATYFAQCAEFCGTSHANMRFRVIVESPEDFDKWVAKQKQPPVAVSDAAKAGQTLFQQKVCIVCHTISGVPGAVGIVGPNLTNLLNRKTLASAIMENNNENLVKWIQAPRSFKPGALMILPIPVNEEEATQLAAFLMSEPAQ